MNLFSRFTSPAADRVVCSEYPTNADRVALAAQALDAIRPGWEDKVNLDTLNLADVELCVLGQVFEDKIGELLDCGAGCCYHKADSGYDYASMKLYDKFSGYQVAWAVFADDLTYRKHWVALIEARQAAKVPAKADHALTA